MGPKTMNDSAAPQVSVPSPTNYAERVQQIHGSYLKSVYATDYFKEVHRQIMQFAKHFDFAIGLGAAVSGGSGLGILRDPRFAWVCAALTTMSVVLTIAKTSYDWPGKLKSSSDLVEKYGRLSGKYQILVEDMNYRKSFGDDFDSAYKKLRDEELGFSPSLYPSLSLEKQRQIQSAIKQRIDYRAWWGAKQ